MVFFDLNVAAAVGIRTADGRKENPKKNPKTKLIEDYFAANPQAVDYPTDAVVLAIQEQHMFMRDDGGALYDGPVRKKNRGYKESDMPKKGLVRRVQKQVK